MKTKTETASKKVQKVQNRVRNGKTATSRAAVSVEHDFSPDTLMLKKASSFAFDLPKLQQQFLDIELTALRLVNQSKGALVLTPITLHIDKQALETLYANSRPTGKGVATTLHKHLTDSFKYHLKRNVIFHLAFGVAYAKNGANVARRDKDNTNAHLLYHVHITALLTPKEADSRFNVGKLAHKALKCLNKLPKTAQFKKQECHFTTKSELETFETQYATYKQHGSRQRWGDYKAENVKQAIYRDKKANNNYFEKLTDLHASSRALKTPKQTVEVRIDKILKDAELNRQKAKQQAEWNESTLTPAANNDLLKFKTEHERKIDAWENSRYELLRDAAKADRQLDDLLKDL